MNKKTIMFIFIFWHDLQILGSQTYCSTCYSSFGVKISQINQLVSPSRLPAYLHERPKNFFDNRSKEQYVDVYKYKLESTWYNKQIKYWMNKEWKQSSRLDSLISTNEISPAESINIHKWIFWRPSTHELNPME
jgi:hypothetical protein